MLRELADYAIKTSQGKDIVVLLMHDILMKEETAKALANNNKNTSKTMDMNLKTLS